MLCDGSAFTRDTALGLESSLSLGVDACGDGIWSPLSLSPTLWLDASDTSTLYNATVGGSLVTADGAVARWEDKSGNGRHVVQANSTYRPLRKPGIQNGRDVLRFDGSNDGMRCATNSPFSGGSFSISVLAVVIRRGNLLNFSSILSQSPSIPGQGMAMGYFLYQGNRLTTDRWAPAGRQTDETNNLSLNYPNLIGWICPVWGSNRTNTSIYVNGVGKSTSAYGTSITESNVAAGPLTVGNWDFARPDMAWPGDIAELIVFPTALNNENRAAAEKYLLTKWGITLP